MDWNLLLEAFLRATRAAAFVTGALVLLDSIGILLSATERPAHNPRANALAWLFIAGTTVSVSVWLLGNRHIWLVSEDSPSAQAAVVTLWTGLVMAFTTRAMSRAKRPLLPLASAVLFIICGAGFGLIETVP